jgi:hypothetical protein
VDAVDGLFFYELLGWEVSLVEERREESRARGEDEEMENRE